MRETQHLTLPGGDGAHPDGDLLLIFTVGPDGRPERCIQANNEACRVLGLSRTILFGLDPNGLFRDALPDAHGDVDAWLPVKLRSAAGPLIELNAQMFPVRAGGERLLVLACRDLATGQHTAQRHRTQFAAMEASQDGIAILNDHFECVYANEALVELYGYPTRHQLHNKPWQEFCPKDDWKHAFEEGKLAVSRSARQLACLWLGNNIVCRQSRPLHYHSCCDTYSHFWIGLRHEGWNPLRLVGNCL